MAFVDTMADVGEQGRHFRRRAAAGNGGPGVREDVDRLETTARCGHTVKNGTDFRCILIAEIRNVTSKSGI